MHKRFKYILIKYLILSLGLASVSLSHARDSLIVAINAETEINVEVIHAKSPEKNLLFIWQPHEEGLRPIDYELAQQLANMGIEVWLLDLLSAYFLENTTLNMSKLNGDGFKALISAGVKTNKRVIIGSSDRASVPLLRGARDWQLANRDHTRFIGAISLSPKLYVKTPAPGTPASLLPIVSASNLPYFILQPDKSPAFWQLKQTINALQQAGSEVYLQPLKGLRDRFYFRPDAFAHETKASDNLARQLYNAIIVLSFQQNSYRTPHARLKQTSEQASKKEERNLTTYQGNPQPEALILPQLNGETLDLKSLRGKVVLVNFWASWCPPCVHEMPSMQRLYDRFDKNIFTILGVNMAETREEVQRFLTTRVKVEFPIVMDYDGTALQAWRVYAFPTSYVLDKQGKIRLALFGSVDWDRPDIIGQVKQLIDE